MANTPHLHHRHHLAAVSSLSTRHAASWLSSGWPCWRVLPPGLHCRQRRFFHQSPRLHITACMGRWLAAHRSESIVTISPILNLIQISAVGDCVIHTLPMACNHLRPDVPAPTSGPYEELNVFGTPTGNTIFALQGEKLPSGAAIIHEAAKTCAKRDHNCLTLHDSPRRECNRAKVVIRISRLAA